MRCVYWCNHGCNRGCTFPVWDKPLVYQILIFIFILIFIAPFQINHAFLLFSFSAFLHNLILELFFLLLVLSECSVGDFMSGQVNVSHCDKLLPRSKGSAVGNPGGFAIFRHPRARRPSAPQSKVSFGDGARIFLTIAVPLRQFW